MQGKPQFALLATGLFVLLAVGAAAQAPPPPSAIDYDTAGRDRRLPAQRASGAIVLDGKLDEASWAGAPIAKGFIQNDPREGAAGHLRHRSEAALRRRRALHRRLCHRRPSPREIIVNELRKDFNTGNADGFSVIIDSFHDERNGYQFCDQSRRRQVGRADVQRRPRHQRQLGRHLGRRHADRRDRLVRRDQDSVQDAEVQIRRRADLGHQLPAPSSPGEREQLLVADPPHLSIHARLDGRHASKGSRACGPGANLRFKPYALGNFSKVAGHATDRGLRRRIRRQVRRHDRH